MRIAAVCWLLASLGCATELNAHREPVAPVIAAGCRALPDRGRDVGFRHGASRLIAHLGGPRHRGTDLIASTTGAQVIEGDLRYGKLDKALEDETVEVFGCLDEAWRLLGPAQTDEHGHFALALGGSDRLPAGLHELYASVRGDRTGVGLIAFIAEPGARVAVTDIDGTLTSSENAVVGTVLLHREAGVRVAAAEALSALVARGYQTIYLTSRGRPYTETTRRWLAGHGFPPGPMMLADGHFARPGTPSLAHKQRALDRLRDAGLDIAIGIGNRTTDIAAYHAAGVRPDRIFIQRSDFGTEVAPHLARGEAIGFDSYRMLPSLLGR